MKIKVSFFSRMLWRRYLVLVSGISVFASLFFVAVDIADDKKFTVLVGISAALIMSYVALWIKANKATSKKLNINGSPLEVKIGDIFEEDELKVINFNEYFDTIADDTLIAKSSLNGKYLINKVTDISVLDKNIANDSHLSEMKVAENTSRTTGKKIQYGLGSIHMEGDYLLVAFSRFDKDNKANLLMREYINCLMTFWEEVDRVYASKSVAIPLMGSGITRFRDANVITEQELLELLIWSFKVSRVKVRHPAKVTIVIHESMKDKINFYELKG
jgi:hypothetical protein